MPDLTGLTIGRYHIVGRLGEGGMSNVYRAFDTHLECDVAMKVIRREAFPTDVAERILKRFEREARVLARLNHPNIVPVMDYGEHDGAPFLVMRYMPGGTLKARLGQPLHFVEAARLLLPVASALEYAHQQNILHRDVKPSNILMSEGGTPVLTDFGIARLLDAGEGHTLTGTGAGIGTPEYMAPEQGLGKPVDGRADVYSLGIVFFELVTGRRPYEGDTPMAVMLMHVTEPLPRPRSLVPGLPDVVEKILIKALAKKPEDRFPNMAAFATALERLIAEDVVGGKPARGPGVKLPGMPSGRKGDTPAGEKTPTPAEKTPAKTPAEQPAREKTPSRPPVLKPPPASEATIDTGERTPLPARLKLKFGRVHPVFYGLAGLLVLAGGLIFTGLGEQLTGLLPTPLPEANRLATAYARTAAAGTEYALAHVPPSQTPSPSPGPTRTLTPISGQGFATQAAAEITGTALAYTLTASYQTPNAGQVVQTIMVRNAAQASATALAESAAGASELIATEIIAASTAAAAQTGTAFPAAATAEAQATHNSLTRAGRANQTPMPAGLNLILRDNIEEVSLINTIDLPGGGPKSMTALAISPDSRQISAALDGTIFVVDTDSKAVLKKLSVGTAVYRLAYSPGGSMLAAALATNQIAVWTIADWEKVQTFTVPEGTIRSLNFSPGGSMLAAGGDARVILVWRVEDGRLLHTLRGHSNTVNTLVFSPDGNSIVSGSEDRSIAKWILSEERVEWRSRTMATGINMVSYAPDETHILSCAPDGTIRLWKDEDGTLAEMIYGLETNVLGAGFTLDQKVIVAMLREGKLAFFDAQTNEMLRYTNLTILTDSLMFAMPSNGRNILAGYPDGRILVYGLK